jgi:D-sedoheptulose 7-phosphate isomerase
MKQEIIKIIEQAIKVKQALLDNDQLLEATQDAATLLISAFQNNRKVLFCGNGGSAADAQHLAAELSGRFYLNRPALYAEALHVNSSFVTAVSNDFGYDQVFSRMIEASGIEGDVLVALSTSGNSQGIINAIETAKNRKMHVIGLTGDSGGKMKDMCSIIIKVPSSDTPRIQEAHIMLGHIICQQVELSLFES